MDEHDVFTGVSGYYKIYCILYLRPREESTESPTAVGKETSFEIKPRVEYMYGFKF